MQQKSDMRGVMCSVSRLHVPKPRGSKVFEIRAAADKKSEADIYIYDIIGDSWDGTTAKQFTTDLRALGGSVTTLNIYINSGGGSVFDGVAIYNALARHKARKVVHIDGLAASIASIIAMVGDEIIIAENSMMMIHNPWSIAMGEARDFRKAADTLDQIRVLLLDTYVARTGGRAEDISRMMDDETWMTAAEAIDMGFADKISDAVKAAAFAGADLSVYRHPPEVLTQVSASSGEETAPVATGSAMPADLALRVAKSQATLVRRGLA